MNTSNKSERTDLLVVGGGIAGCAVALACAAELQRVVILHAGDERQGTESISPDGCRRLKQYSIDIGSTFSSVLAWWGADHVVTSPCPGARVVQRNALADQIRGRAMEKAVLQRCKSILTLARGDGMWTASYRDHEGVVRSIEAKNICDATGRRGAVGRLLGARRINLDKLCCMSVSIVDFKKVGTWTEATSNGWWNLCSDGNKTTLAFYSLPNLFRNAGRTFETFFVETQEMRRMISITNHSAPRVLVCGSSILAPCAGPGWFAVGDAAMTVQPLASAGIAKALRDSQLALKVLETDGLEYYSRYRQEFADYSKSLSAQYELEGRWKESDFWKHFSRTHHK